MKKTIRRMKNIQNNGRHGRRFGLPPLHCRINSPSRNPATSTYIIAYLREKSSFERKNFKNKGERRFLGTTQQKERFFLFPL